MKWDGTSSDETKKQPYSIIERFMLKYPDPDSKLLDKELREGYKEAREAIIEAMESIDRERAQRIKEGRTESTRSTDSAKENVKYATGDDYTFNKQVDDAVSGKMARGYSVFVGKTPNLLEKAGLEQRPMLINQAHLRDIVHEKTNDNAHYHGIDINIIKQLSKLLKNPVAIYDSISNDNRNNSICVVTNKFDGDGNPIIVSIRSSENNVKYYDVSFNTVRSEKSNYATSVYGKDNFRYHLEAILDNDSFIFVSKSGTEKLLNKIIPRLNSDIKLQLLERLDNLGYNTIIHKSNNVVNTHSMQNGKKYAVSDSYSRKIDEWYKSGKSDNESFALGSTGDVLQGLGAIESDIYMNSDKINRILDKHKEITVAEIKKIPEILEDPVFILKSQNKDRGGKQNTRLIIFGSVKGQDGRPVLSVLDLRPVENNLAINDMQKVSSVYTKDNNPVAFIENSDVVYADKKRTANLLKSIGFQMPIELRQSGYIGSISYIKRSVNIQGENPLMYLILLPIPILRRLTKNMPCPTRNPGTTGGKRSRTRSAA